MSYFCRSLNLLLLDVNLKLFQWSTLIFNLFCCKCYFLSLFSCFGIQIPIKLIVWCDRRNHKWVYCPLMQIPELYNVNVKFSALRTKLLWFWSLFRVSFHSLYRTLSITQIWLALHTLFRVWPLLWYAKMFREVCLEVIDL